MQGVQWEQPSEAVRQHVEHELGKTVVVDNAVVTEVIQVVSETVVSRSAHQTIRAGVVGVDRGVAGLTIDHGAACTWLANHAGTGAAIDDDVVVRRLNCRVVVVQTLVVGCRSILAAGHSAVICILDRNLDVVAAGAAVERERKVMTLTGDAVCVGRNSRSIVSWIDVYVQAVVARTQGVDKLGVVCLVGSGGVGQVLVLGNVSRIKIGADLHITLEGGSIEDLDVTQAVGVHKTLERQRRTGCNRRSIDVTCLVQVVSSLIDTRADVQVIRVSLGNLRQGARVSRCVSIYLTASNDASFMVVICTHDIHNRNFTQRIVG